MKRIFLIALIGVGLLALISPLFSGSSAARPPESYPLVCRGGPLLPIYIAPGVTNIGFKFTHSTKPASEGLLPGQCSWVDRGMYDTEPDRVSQHVEVGEPVKGAPIWPETLKVHLNPENRWYEELHSSEKRWTFMVYNDGLGQLIVTSARSTMIDEDTTTTVIFKPVPEGAKTWQWWTHWRNEGPPGFTCADFDWTPDAGSIDFPKEPGQITAGFHHYWDGGHWPFPCQQRSTFEFVGTVWFDLNEIFSKSPMPKAETATLTFKAIASDGPGGVCKDELRLPGDDWMKGLPENTLPKTGSLEPAVYFEGCPSEGCSIDVTSIVNNWITGREDRYGFAISGRDDLAAIGTDDGKNPDNNAHCTTRYGDFSLTVKRRFKSGPIIIPLPSARKNFALASNEATARASSTLPGWDPSGAINGDRAGINWGSGGGWADATKGVFPDWLEVDFKDGKTHEIDQIDVFTLQDNYKSPKDPGVEMMSFTTSGYGLTAYEVQVEEGGSWVTVGSVSVSDPMYVGHEFHFSPRTTNKIRVLTHAAVDNGYSRITEVEAWGTK